MPEEKLLAQILYEAYCESTGWKSAITGAPLPQFSDCPAAVKQGWQAVADAAATWSVNQCEADGHSFQD